MSAEVPDTSRAGIASRSLPFAAENERLARLAQCQPVALAGSHHVLTEGVWLSSEPEKGAELAVLPSGTGFTLALATVGKSRWISLSFTLPIETLRSGRYFCLLVRAASDAFLSYRPALRYLLAGGGFQDNFARDYMVSSGGEKEQLSYILIDPDAAARSQAAEAHLFFQGANFRADFRSIEAFLIV